MDNRGCELNLPYPPIEVKGKNLCYAQLLQRDYTGKNGEMTAVTQYFYQHLTTKACNEALADELECVSIVEMRHLEMLGELIVLLGGVPVFRTTEGCVNTFWCGDNVQPTQNIKKFLQNNIAAEKIAIQNYRQHVMLIKDPKIQAVLERIILDEEHHIALFTKALSELPG